MTIREARPDDLEVDLHSLARALFRSLVFLIPLAILAAIGAYVALTKVQPQYRAEAKILIETSESDVTRPQTADNASTQALLDEQGVTSQVELIQSREVALAVVQKLGLDKLPEFDPVLKGPGLLEKYLVPIGLMHDPAASPAEERVLDSFFRKLSVFPVEKSRVIAIDFTANDPNLAAQITNEIAAQYLVAQAAAKRGVNQDATAYLASEIADLQVKVKDAEAKVEQFRSSSDLFSAPGNNGATLAQQQLIDLNTELGRVRATRADAEARAAQIRAGLQNGSAFNSLDVLKSALIERLNEQAVNLRAQIAQLSATLLPNHPRMRELNAQLGDLDAQIRKEANKILAGVENDARLAAGREQEILRSLDALKATATKSGDASVQLRALERDAAAQRDVLETYMRQYREALARQNGNYLPINARIASRAAAPVDPSFPKKTPLSIAAAAAVFILGACIVLVRELATRKPIHALRYYPIVPAPASESAEAFAEEGSVRRMMPRDRLETPPFGGGGERTLSNIGKRILELEASRVIVATVDSDSDAGRPLAAVALARTLARAGSRTLLLDFRSDGADRGAMQAGGGNILGFSDLMAGEASFGQVIFRDRTSPAHFIPAGRAKLPRKWQDEARFGTLMDALQHTYDQIIVDAEEPVLSALAPAAGAVVLISEAAASDPATMEAYERLDNLAAGEVMLLVTPSETAREAAA